jgi:NADH:ubiquinone oxidoreductase subunit 2 (subunit N)
LLCAETAAWLTLLFGCLLLLSPETGGDYDEGFGGALLRQPMPATIMLLGLFSLAGLPPFPGFWWRFSLLSAWMLPYHQSVLTGVMEPHPGARAIACLFVLLWIVTALGHLRLVRILVLNDPFRVRTRQPSVRLWLGAAFSLLLLGVSWLVSLV